MRTLRHSFGFSLVELVIVIAITGIVAAMVGLFVSGPVRGFIDQQRRAELVDKADMALQQMARDVRRALPNSLRVSTAGTVVSVTMLNTIGGARYRARGPGDTVQFNSGDASFDIFLPANGIVPGAYNSPPGFFLVIFNTGQVGADAYAFDPVITPAGTNISVGALGPSGANVTLTPAPAAPGFGFQSTGQRLFLVDATIRYDCDTATGVLNRRVVAGTVSSNPAGGVVSTVANMINACTFQFAAGSAQRAGLLTLQLSLTSQGEVVRLLRQIHVSNSA